MTDQELDKLVEAQSMITVLWPRLRKLRSMDVVNLCKLRHRMEREDGFIPDENVLEWLRKLTEVNR